MSAQSLALRLTQHGKVAAKEHDVADFVPYTRHVDPATLATKNGELLQIIKLDGYPFETADDATLDGLKETRSTLAIALASSRHILYHHLVRRRVPADLGGAFSGFAADVDAAWQRRLHRTRLYVNDLYLTILRRPAPGLAGLVDWVRGLFTDHELHRREEDRADSLRELHDATETVIKTLAHYRPRLLTTYEDGGRLYSEPLELLSYLLNQERRPVLLPAGPIDAYLPSKRPFFTKELLELRGAAPADQTYGAIVSIKDYAAGTWAGMLDELTELPFEMTVTQSFAYDERAVALEKLTRQGRIMDAALDAAASQREDLLVAADDLASNRIAFGGHHISILLSDPDEKRLEQALTDTTAKLTSRGVIAVREDVNLEPAFWAQLPGNHHYIARRADISSLNWASYVSLHNYPAGTRAGNHWGEAIALLQTKSATPYAFNFHSGDVGNFTVVGPTGTGKTVVLTFLLAQAQRHQPASFFFDRDRGAELFIRALGGWYGVLRPGVPAGLNPLQLPDSPENRSFLRGWLFDNATDALPDARIQGFDLTYVLDDPILRVPLLLYLFHRIEQALTGQKALVFLDEGWRALDDPVFEESLRSWLKTIRKKNGLVGFGTQSASDIVNTRIGPTILEQCRTQLFMPHFKANARGYCEGFGLTPHELSVVQQLGETSRCFLVKHDTTSVVAQLDLSGEDDMLAILSGREETVHLLDAIRAEVGDDPAVWLPVFQERRKAL